MSSSPSVLSSCNQTSAQCRSPERQISMELVRPNSMHTIPPFHILRPRSNDSWFPLNLKDVSSECGRIKKRYVACTLFWQLKKIPSTIHWCLEFSYHSRFYLQRHRPVTGTVCRGLQGKLGAIISNYQCTMARNSNLLLIVLSLVTINFCGSLFKKHPPKILSGRNALMSWSRTTRTPAQPPEAVCKEVINKTDPS